MTPRQFPPPAFVLSSGTVAERFAFKPPSRIRTAGWAIVSAIGWLIVVDVLLDLGASYHQWGPALANALWLSAIALWAVRMAMQRRLGWCVEATSDGFRIPIAWRSWYLWWRRRLRGTSLDEARWTELQGVMTRSWRTSEGSSMRSLAIMRGGTARSLVGMRSDASKRWRPRHEELLSFMRTQASRVGVTLGGAELLPTPVSPTPSKRGQRAALGIAIVLLGVVGLITAEMVRDSWQRYELDRHGVLAHALVVRTYQDGTSDGATSYAVVDDPGCRCEVDVHVGTTNHAPGSTLDVRYDPSDPTKVIAAEDWPIEPQVWTAVVAALLALAAYSSVRKKLRRRRGMTPGELAERPSRARAAPPPT